jgi:hypothetical protein
MRVAVLPSLFQSNAISASSKFHSIMLAIFKVYGKGAKNAKVLKAAYVPKYLG